MAQPVPDYDLGFLVAEVELGLAFARLAATANDVWLAARERAKAEQAYDTVLRLKHQLGMAHGAHPDLSRRLEELRLAIQRLSTH